MEDNKYSREDAYQSLEMVNSWINNVDSKVSYALAFIGVIIGFVFIQGTPKAFTNISQADEITCRMLLESILVVLLYIASFLAIVFLVLAIIARTQFQTSKRSAFFFGTIANEEKNSYVERVTKMSEKEIIEDILGQVHINSGICLRKMKLYNIGITFFTISIILCFICMIFHLL